MPPITYLSTPTVVCFDAKINFDDAAKFRQKPIFEQEDTSESDPREVEAAMSDLNYIGMTGNIGCLGNCRCHSRCPIHSACVVYVYSRMHKKVQLGRACTCNFPYVTWVASSPGHSLFFSVARWKLESLVCDITVKMSQVDDLQGDDDHRLPV